MELVVWQLKHRGEFLERFKNRAWHIPGWLQRLDAVTVASARRTMLVRRRARTRTPACVPPRWPCCWPLPPAVAPKHALVCATTLVPADLAALLRRGRLPRWAAHVRSHHRRRVRLSHPATSCSPARDHACVASLGCCRTVPLTLTVASCCAPGHAMLRPPLSHDHYYR